MISRLLGCLKWMGAESMSLSWISCPRSWGRGPHRAKTPPPGCCGCRPSLVFTQGPLPDPEAADLIAQHVDAPAGCHRAESRTGTATSSLTTSSSTPAAACSGSGTLAALPPGSRRQAHGRAGRDSLLRSTPARFWKAGRWPGWGRALDDAFPGPCPSRRHSGGDLTGRAPVPSD